MDTKIEARSPGGREALEEQPGGVVAQSGEEPRGHIVTLCSYLRAQAEAMVTKTVESESQPWSNSSPSGQAVPVRRACLPSIASKLWETMYNHHRFFGLMHAKSLD